MRYYSIMAIILFLYNSGYAQKDNQAAQQVKTIAKRLMIDEDKAVRVHSIITAYKASVKTVFKNSQLPETEKRKRIDGLMMEKNFSLNQLLSREQLYKIIPGSERLSIDPAYAKQFNEKQLEIKRQKNLQHQGATPVRRGDKKSDVLAVQLDYNNRIIRLKSQSELSDEEKKKKIDSLRREQYDKMASVLQLYDKESHSKRDSSKK